MKVAKAAKGVVANAVGVGAGIVQIAQIFALTTQKA